MESNEEQVIRLFEITRESQLGLEHKATLMEAIAVELKQVTARAPEWRLGHRSASEYEAVRKHSASSVLALCTILFVMGCLGWVGVESTPFVAVQEVEDDQPKAASKTRLLKLIPELSNQSVQYFLRQ